MNRLNGIVLEHSLRIKPSVYYADFVFYPLALGAAILWTVPVEPSSFAIWASFVVAGLAAWTLVEYILHRGVFHGVPWFSAYHEAHHADPNALIGTPFWAGIAWIAVALAALTLIGGRTKGGGLCVGLAIGYFGYIVVHHVVHHWPLSRSSYLRGVRRSHALHHFNGDQYNFGVTTRFWDRVFRTDSPMNRRRAAKGAEEGAAGHAV